MLKHLLLNPSGYSRHLLRAALHIMMTTGLSACLPATLAAVIALAVRSVILRRRHARVALHARQVVILAPPVASPDGALVLWTHLTGLLRSPWRRLISGQPHLAFEYLWTDAGAQISMWVPGTVPPGLAERAIEAAWPGALTRTIAAQSPIPASAVTKAGWNWPAPTITRCGPITTLTRSGRYSPPPRDASWATRPCGRYWPARSPDEGSARPGT